MTRIETDRTRIEELNRLTEQIIGCAFKVSNTLGEGYLEKVYENALAVELKRAGLRAEQQRRLTVSYQGVKVGDYVADLVVEEDVLVEVKAVRALEDAHRAQCVNYLTTTGLPLGLLLNFTSRVEIKRVAVPALLPYAAAQFEGSSPIDPSVFDRCKSVSSVPTLPARDGLRSAILITWRRNGGYCRRLVEDLAPDQWLAQPVPGRVMNHPAWITSHLNVYAPIMAALCRREPFDDPLDHRHGQKSKASLDPREYAAPELLLAEYGRLHDEAQNALESADDDVFAEPNPLERWRSVHPLVGDMLVTLMVKHESGHLGQLSAWRRAMGLPSVAM